MDVKKRTENRCRIAFYSIALCRYIDMIYQKVSLAVRVIDIFGSLNITDALVTTDKGISAINKKNGFYIFCGLSPGDYQIIISVNKYIPIVQDAIVKERFDGDVIIASVIPAVELDGIKKRTGVLPSKKIPPNGTIYYPIYTKMITLMEQVKNGALEIKLLAPNAIILEGLRMCFESAQNSYTVYRIQKYIFEKNACILNTPLKERQFNKGTYITVLAPSSIDSNGKFHIVTKVSSHNSELNGAIYIPPKERINFKDIEWLTN